MLLLSSGQVFQLVIWAVERVDLMSCGLHHYAHGHGQLRDHFQHLTSELLILDLTCVWREEIKYHHSKMVYRVM